MPAVVTMILLAGLPLGQVPESAGPVSPRTAEPPARRVQPDDARLCDVCFIDPEHGWSVGDHGVILRTDDGGLHWSPQASGVDCTLHSVCFVDARNGWAAGGRPHPFLHDSSGVVLSTRDGGVTWQRHPVLLPAIRKIRFPTDRQGWAIGGSSAMYPGGAYLTRDGGHSWQPACGGGAAELFSGDFYTLRAALLGGARGLIAAITDNDFSRRAQPASALQSVRAMQCVAPSYGWLAGDGGWVALTADQGNTWRPPLGALPAGAGLFDFSALAVRGPRCWIAGAPGSQVFFTADAGRTWSAAATGTPTPLTAVAFVDDRRGWAVGHLGVILATGDGGRTWRRQRAAGARAAVMAIAGRAEDLPLEIIARTCKDQGFLGIGQVLCRDDFGPGPRSEAPQADRVHEAMLQLGACGGETAWAFPVRPRTLVTTAKKQIDEWNAFHHGQGSDALVVYIVRQIRTWRPDVILVPASRARDGVGEIVRESVLAAVKRAADATYLSDRFGLAGPEPWSVQRVYAVSDAGSPGRLALDCGDWSPRLGRTWTDAALPARALLETGFEAGPATLSVQLLGGAEGNPGAAEAGGKGSSDAGGCCDVMARLPNRNPPARRPAAGGGPAGGPLEGLAQRRQVQAMFERADQDPEVLLAGLARGDELPSGIDAGEAAILTFRIASRFCQAGRWDLADRAFASLIDRFPDDPLARRAIVWRLEYRASGLAEMGEAAGATGRLGESRAEEALLLARQIESLRPDLFASPAVRYPLASVHRRLGQDSQTQRLYAIDRRGVDRDAWWHCARGELWLMDRKGPPPRPMVACPAATERPHLDGRLDDALWKKSAPIKLSSKGGGDRDWPAEVKLAHDDQHLYVAIECRRAAGFHYEAAAGRRTRDPDLSESDRVDICLDIGRTYATCYRLTIDHRGWAADAWCNQNGWNPKWFVAGRTAEGAWSAEAAIPLAELNAKIVPGKTVWGVGLQRTIPGVGQQAWPGSLLPEPGAEGLGWVEME